MKKKIISVLRDHFHPWKARFFKFLSHRKYWILVIISAFCFADLMLISLHPFLLFSTSSGSNKTSQLPQKKVSMAEYTPIWDFNIFHNAAIPPSLSSSQHEEDNLKPRLSRLPLQLNGTIVYTNPAYSIANITIKGQKTSESYQIDDEIENKTKSPLARITQITSERVYFINLNSNQEEYIEVPNIRNISFDFDGGKKDKKSEKSNKTDNNVIKKIGDSQFQINRSDLNKYIRSLPQILQEAKAVPHRENGEIIGWRLTYIKPGSIIEQLNIKKSDIVISVNNETPRSHFQAAELLQRLKNQSTFDVIVRGKGGKEERFNYSIAEDTSIEELPRSRYY